MPDTADWTAAIRDDFQALAVDARRVHIYRRIGGRVEVITGFTDAGVAVAQTFDEAVAIDFPGFTIPIGALEALAEQLKPGPSQGETKRLEEALNVERRRVDDMLAAYREQAVRST